MIDIIRIHSPLEVDCESISKVKKQLKTENSTFEEKIKEIFSEIGVDVDLIELADFENNVYMESIAEKCFVIKVGECNGA